jgi:GTP cyclohydrolase II
VIAEAAVGDQLGGLACDDGYQARAGLQGFDAGSMSSGGVDVYGRH